MSAREVAKQIISKSKSEDNLVAYFNQIGTKGAKAQHAMIQEVEQVLVEANLYRSSDFVDQIMMGQNEKIMAYGQKAYPMSDNQLKVIAKHIFVYVQWFQKR